MGGCLSQADPGAQKGAVGSGTSMQKQVDVTEAIDALLGFRDCTSKLDIRLQCKQLRSQDGLFGKSDPFCVLYEQKEDVDFVKSFVVLYNFELQQTLMVKVYDMDSKVSSADNVDLSKQDYLGSVEFEMAELVRAPSQQLLKSLGGRAGAKGTVTITAEEVVDFKKDMTFTVSGQKLANMDGLGGKSDPFLRVLRSKEVQKGELWQPVLQSGTIKDNANPVWAGLKVALGRLCGGDYSLPLLWQVMDWDKSGNHDLIGKAKASVDDILTMAQNRNSLELANPKLKAGKAGRLFFSDVRITDSYSFLDYLQQGLEIDFFVAVDFTASNGRPTDPSSLHYGTETQYEQAIKGVGAILDFYNADKLYTAWAFGARVNNGVTSHCYPLNGNPADSRVVGTAGILAAYRGMLQNSQLSGPTNFSPVIRATIAATRPGGARYSCLLILTDGEISDMEHTVRAIIEAADLPLSILIVGIGNASFRSMDVLDSDDARLRDPSTGQVAARDIVQFVPFSRFAGRGTALASEVLAELPGQIVQYMTYDPWSHQMH